MLRRHQTPSENLLRSHVPWSPSNVPLDCAISESAPWLMGWFSYGNFGIVVLHCARWSQNHMVHGLPPPHYANSTRPLLYFPKYFISNYILVISNLFNYRGYNRNSGRFIIKKSQKCKKNEFFIINAMYFPSFFNEIFGRPEFF